MCMLFLRKYHWTLRSRIRAIHGKSIVTVRMLFVVPQPVSLILWATYKRPVCVGWLSSHRNLFSPSKIETAIDKIGKTRNRRNQVKQNIERVGFFGYAVQGWLCKISARSFFYKYNFARRCRCRWWPAASGWSIVESEWTEFDLRRATFSSARSTSHRIIWCSFASGWSISDSESECREFGLVHPTWAEIPGDNWAGTGPFDILEVAKQGAFDYFDLQRMQRSKVMDESLMFEPLRAGLNPITPSPSRCNAGAVNQAQASLSSMSIDLNSPKPIHGSAPTAKVDNFLWGIFGDDLSVDRF